MKNIRITKANFEKQAAAITATSSLFDRTVQARTQSIIDTVARKGDRAVIDGVKRLKGASIMASDIRGGAGLTLAGLGAAGTTEILRIYHIDRGYENIEERLRKLGAQIWRQEE